MNLSLRWRAVPAAAALIATATAALHVVSACPGSGFVQQETTVVVLPAEGYVAVGATTTLEVAIENVGDLYAVDVSVGFDPRHVRIVDADSEQEGVQVRPLGGFLRPQWLLKNEADNSVGSVWYAASQLHPTAAVTGSGAVLAMDFRGLVEGTSPITISSHSLMSRAKVEVAATAHGGRLHVVAGSVTPPVTPSQVPTLSSATPTGTATASPTATPTLAPPSATCTADTPTAGLGDAFLPVVARGRSG